MEGNAIRRQFVVFANFRTKIKDFASRLKVYLDLKGYAGDVTTVASTQYKKQKMHHATLFLLLFLTEAPDSSSPVVDKGFLDAVACLATHTICWCLWLGLLPHPPWDGT